MHSCSAVVMGRATYEIAPRVGVVDPYPYLETYVFSRTLTPVDHPNVRVVRDDPAAYLAALKQPFLMGNGIRIAETLPAIAPLALTATKDYGNGVLLLTYRPTAAPATQP